MSDKTLRKAAQLALAALERQNSWHEAEKKVISKSGRKDTDAQWRFGRHLDEIEALAVPIEDITAALAAPQPAIQGAKE